MMGFRKNFNLIQLNYQQWRRTIEIVTKFVNCNWIMIVIILIVQYL